MVKVKGPFRASKWALAIKITTFLPQNNNINENEIDKLQIKVKWPLLTETVVSKKDPWSSPQNDMNGTPAPLGHVGLRIMVLGAPIKPSGCALVA